jgi:hypothetical protein
MKLLYILKKEPTDTVNNMIESHIKKAEVTVIDMRENKNYEEIIDKVFENDKVVTW